MKKLTKSVSTEVVIKRGDESVTLTVSALPLGYTQYLERVYPEPVLFKNGELVPDPARRSEWTYECNLLCIARALGDQMDATPPTTGDRDAWAQYARAVRAEFEDAGMVEGDLAEMIKGLARCQRGVTAAGKA